MQFCSKKDTQTKKDYSTLIDIKINEKLEILKDLLDKKFEVVSQYRHQNYRSECIYKQCFC